MNTVSIDHRARHHGQFPSLRHDILGDERRVLYLQVVRRHHVGEDHVTPSDAFIL
jgi:hypothetical protein